MLNLLICLKNSNKWIINSLSTFQAGDPAYASSIYSKWTKQESDFSDGLSDLWEHTREVLMES